MPIMQTLADPLQLQSMADFERECREKEEASGNSVASKNTKPPPAKKQKKIVDGDALGAEKEALEKLGNINWIGKLNEYRSAHPVRVAGGLTYAECPSAQDPTRHTCTVVITESPNHFGGDGISFSRKKDAKQHASKQAIEWLISGNYMPADGTVKFPKIQPRLQLPPKPGSVHQPLQTIMNVPQVQYSNGNGKSWASQVPSLCIRLGFEPARYELTKAAEDVPLYSGFAHFGNDPRIVGKVGIVENVHGRKNAKEAIAEELVSFLKDIERQRLEGEGHKRKRSTTIEGESTVDGWLASVSE